MNCFKFIDREIFCALRFPISLGLFILCAAQAFALDPEKSIFQFNCQNWTRQSGLPANKINTIAQSQDGFIWLGTQNGLVRFDGVEFKTIPVDLPQAWGQDVRSLVAAPDGSLKFAINNGGFGSYDGKKFSTIGDQRWWWPNINATTLFETADGTLWTAAELGTGRLPGGNFAASFFAATNTGIVLSICGDNSGGVWMGTTEHGLFHWADGKFTEMPDELLRTRNIFAVAMDAEGQIWVGSGHGLVCYANGHVKATPAFVPEAKVLLFDKHGVLWIGTSGSGLARYQNGRFTFLTKSDGLGGDYITSLFEDGEGSLWVGTRDGLSQLTDLKFPIYSIKEGLPRGSCHSVFASHRGGLWLTTDTGFSYFNGQHFINYTNNSLLPNHYIKFIFEARDGNAYIVDGDKNILVFSGDVIKTRYTNSLWPTAITEDAPGLLLGLGTGNGLYRLQEGELRPYAFGTNAPPDFYWINNMCVARDGTIWVASNNGIFQIKNGSWKQWSTAEGLLGTKVQWIFEDTDGSIWTGSSTGLARIKDGKIRNIKKADGLHDERIYAVVPDEFDSFWIASGGGIFRATRKSLNNFADGKSARVECDVFTGLESVKFNDQTDQEFSGCKTLDGRIWFPNPQGVAMINPAHYFTNGIAPRVYVQEVRVNGVEVPDRANVQLTGGSRVQFFFSALSYIAPQKIQLLYQLEGFDQTWIEAGSQRSVLYNNLKSGKYIFRVMAANADGVWNRTGASVNLKVPPPFYQKMWFVILSLAVVLLVLFGAYHGMIRHIQMRQKKLQAANDALEAKVGKRTQELAGVNATLQHEIEMHKDTEATLKQRTQSLEKEIEERKRMQLEIERVHRELLETSRQAGMAEVATNVLHNVGNVLNSVNISASVVGDKVKKIRTASLVKVAALLREHEAHLGKFFTEDPRGKQLPEYLSQLAEHFAGDQKATVAELELLRANIEHIKEIVAMQQSYARVSGVKEPVNVQELVEDALRMNVISLDRHGVEIVREFADMPLIDLERHKVLQVLVNLIRNANHACQEAERADKRVTVRVTNGAGSVKISIIDNGIGIPAENVTRIFNHGFTTKKDGHGFGLHGGALAATEMGGSLTVQSDGKNLGATFTLELPCNIQEDSK